MTSPEVEKPILQIEKVRVSFDGFVVLDNLDFKVERNELRFLIGPNGAGKTTMLDVITGKVKPASGSIVQDDAARSQLRAASSWTGSRSAIGPSICAPARASAESSRRRRCSPPSR